MAGERAQILQMVAAGELTVEQADQLLQALAEKEAPRPAAAPEAGQPADPGMERVRELFTMAQAFLPPKARVQPIPPMPPMPPMPARAPRVAFVRRRTRGDRVKSNPSFDQLIQLSIHGISPDFVKQVRAAGLDDLTFDDVVQLGIHGVEPEFIRTMKESFGDELGFDDLIQLAIHDVDPAFVREVRASGLGNLSIEQVIQMAIHGVEADTVKQWKEAGLADLVSEDEADGLDEEEDEEEEDAGEDEGS